MHSRNEAHTRTLLTAGAFGRCSADDQTLLTGCPPAGRGGESVKRGLEGLLPVDGHTKACSREKDHNIEETIVHDQQLSEAPQDGRGRAIRWRGLHRGAVCVLGHFVAANQRMK